MPSLSGDQNGYAAPSVPATWRETPVENSRTHSSGRPFSSAATNTTAEPSGETANCAAGIDAAVVRREVFGGGAMSKNTGPALDPMSEELKRNNHTPRSAPTTKAANGTISACHRDACVGWRGAPS